MRQSFYPYNNGEASVCNTQPALTFRLTDFVIVADFLESNVTQLFCHQRPDVLDTTKSGTGRTVIVHNEATVPICKFRGVYYRRFCYIVFSFFV